MRADDKFKEKSITAVLSVVILILFLIGVWAVIKKDMYYIFDWFFSAFIVCVALWIHKRVRLNYTQLVLGLIAIALQHMKLYGKEFFGLHFDGLFHFYTVFVISLILFRYYYSVEKMKKEALLRCAVTAFFVAIALGSLLEIIEYFGYYFLGKGEGILFFGVGDFGEWANSAWDMTANTIGAAFGCLLSYFFLKRK